jgi:cobalamin biosynthetic protein CobC
MTHGETHQRDHGGDLHAAALRYGGAPSDWLDLSTGINPIPYPVPDLPQTAWTRLPGADRLAALEAAARRAYGVAEGAEVVAAPGASALIQALPSLTPPGPVAILSPTYNEHAASFRAAGREVIEAADPPDGVSLVVVNPNNPDGAVWIAGDLRALAGGRPLTIVDESFGDVALELSLCPSAGPEGLIVLRSFGKFYGLAGVRLGFAICGPATALKLRQTLGPWAVSGPAIEIGIEALSDETWAEETRARLFRDAQRLNALMREAELDVAGGTTLFRLVQTLHAAQLHDHLARAHIWTRIFPYRADWLRIAPPGAEDDWARLGAALIGWRA